MAKRKNIYVLDADWTLVARLASSTPGGSESAVYSAALRAYAAGMAEREDMIALAIRDLAAAIEPDEQLDPAADSRAEAPYLVLAALLDEAAARAIRRALNDVWLRWQLPAQRDGTA